MSDNLGNQNWPGNERIIHKMQEEIERHLGENSWKELTKSNEPTADMDNHQLSISTGSLLVNFDKFTDNVKANQIFSKVRHGLTADDFQWAKKKFMEYNDIDRFSYAILENSLEELKKHKQNKTLFYGQPITQEVYDYIEKIDDLFYGKRNGNTITATAIPFRTQNYLNTDDYKIKRYNMCHCQFARESILSERPVSKTMCYCSLGHNLMFWETVLSTELKGDVIESALGNSISCRFIIYLTDEIMKKYVHN
jgi:hypothetical protein